VAAAKLTMTQAEFARRRGVTPARVSQWKVSGNIAITPDGRVDVEASEWMLADRPAQNRGGKVKPPPAEPPKEKQKPGPKPKNRPERLDVDVVGDSASKALKAIEDMVAEGKGLVSHAEAARLKENYLAKLRELEYDVKSGAVVEVAEVGKKVAAEYAAVRAGLLAIPSKTAPMIALMREAEEVSAALTAAIGQALEALTFDQVPRGA
jgi:hypothetical protein